jgi:hypothetical protein
MFTISKPAPENEPFTNDNENYPFPAMSKVFGYNVVRSALSNQSPLRNGQEAMAKLELKPWVVLWMLVIVTPVTSW